VKDRPLAEVVAALLKLGCTIVVESELHIAVCRFPRIIQVTKHSIVPVEFQREYLRKLGFSEDAFLAAMPTP
jgi:hypothetical protein